MGTTLYDVRSNTKMDFFKTASGFLTYGFILQICHAVSTHYVETVSNYDDV